MRLHTSVVQLEIAIGGDQLLLKLTTVLLIILVLVAVAAEQSFLAAMLIYPHTIVAWVSLPLVALSMDSTRVIAHRLHHPMTILHCRFFVPRSTIAYVLGCRWRLILGLISMLDDSESEVIFSMITDQPLAMANRQMQA